MDTFDGAGQPAPDEPRESSDVWRPLHAAWRMVGGDARAQLRAIAALGLLLALMWSLLVVVGRDSLDRAIDTRGPAWPLLVAAVTILTAIQIIRADVAWRRRRAAERIRPACDECMLDAASTFELADFEDPESLGLLSRAREAPHWAPAAGACAMEVAQAALIALGMLAVLGYVAWPAMLVAAVLALPVSLLGPERPSEHHELTEKPAEPDRLRAGDIEALTSPAPAAEMRLSDAEAVLREEIRRIAAERVAASDELHARWLARGVAGELVTAVLFGLGFGTILLTGMRDPADLVAVAVALWLFLHQIGDGARALSRLAEPLQQLGPLLELHERAERGRAPVAESPPSEPTPPAVSLAEVTFTYRDASRPALDRVSFEVRPGDTVAVVGPNGSGKTTLAQLLTGLRRPDEGARLWNGERIDGPAMRTRVAMAPLHPELRLPRDVRGNIAVADRWRNEEALRAAATGAEIELLLGSDRRLAARFMDGAKLSDGQWKAVGLARVFLRDSALSIFDEPTAALDPRRQDTVIERLYEWARGRTAVVLTSCMWVASRADLIYVLLDRQIVGQGTHAELMSRPGYYQREYRRQAGLLEMP